MIPIEFEGHNQVLGKNQEQYLNLPVFRNFNDPEGKVMQVWELTFEDLQTIIETRKIYVMQMTFNQPLQPISIQTETFLVNPDEEKNQQDENQG